MRFKIVCILCPVFSIKTPARPWIELIIEDNFVSVKVCLKLLLVIVVIERLFREYHLVHLTGLLMTSQLVVMRSKRYSTPVNSITENLVPNTLIMGRDLSDICSVWAGLGSLGRNINVT